MRCDGKRTKYKNTLNQKQVSTSFEGDYAYRGASAAAAVATEAVAAVA